MLKGWNVFFIYFFVLKYNISIKYYDFDLYIYGFVEEVDDNILWYCCFIFVVCEW